MSTASRWCSQCETCRVEVEPGTVDDAGSGQGDTVLACLARLTGPAVIRFEEVPEVVTRRGRIAALTALSPDIVEVGVVLKTPLLYRPGQYVRVRFADGPPRDYSPTLRSDGSGGDTLIFQIRRHPGGAVSPHLGGRLGIGCAVAVEGPFGHAYHRPGRGRLILVSGGVGWAPAWSVARESRLREPERDLVVIAGARSPEDLYMRPALAWLRDRGAATTLTCSGPHPPADSRPGRPTEHLPVLTAQDTILAAGSPGLVTAVRELADVVGATCYADPFTAAPDAPEPQTSLIGRAWARFRGRTTPGQQALG